VKYNMVVELQII